jgi:exosortase
MTTVPASRPRGRAPAGPDRWRTWAAAGCLLAAGWLVLFPLSASWNYFSNYAYGWSVPFLAAVLFAERWNRRPAPTTAPARATVVPFVVIWTALFFCLRMGLEVSMVARPLSLAAALLYIGALLYGLWIYGGLRWVRHFLFPVCFLLLAVPWPLQIEDPIVQGLAPLNAWLVAHVLVDFGILAQASGQVIVLPDCTLGVKEACSGLRSLQAALMIAFLFGELFRLAWIRRGQIVVLALALALLGNFLRTLFLALVAYNQGVSALNRWHDSAGMFILVFTSVITFLAAYLLQRHDLRGGAPAPHSAASTAYSPQESLTLRLAGGILLGAVLAETVTHGWFAWRDQNATRYPAWTIQPPDSPTLQDIPIDKESRDVLKYDAGREIKWQDGRQWTWTAYWFRYDRKPWAVSAFTNHNPGKCLPSVGYQLVTDYPLFTAKVHGAPLQVQPREFSWQGNPLYVFWVVYADRSNFPLDEAAGSTPDAPLTKGRYFLSNIWQGKRGTSAETESLEIIISGPQDFATAKSAYLAQLQTMIVPDSSAARGQVVIR